MILLRCSIIVAASTLNVSRFPSSSEVGTAGFYDYVVWRIRPESALTCYCVDVVGLCV